MRGLVLAALIGVVVAPVQPAFKAGVEVTVPITVTNATRDQLITAGLEAAYFRIFEDDEPQAISSWTRQRRPVSLCAVVDASGSMAVAGRHDRGVRRD